MEMLFTWGPDNDLCKIDMQFQRIHTKCLRTRSPALCADLELPDRLCIRDKDFCTWESIKTSVYHFGVKIESVLLVMPPTQLRPRLAKGQIKQCRMGILLESFCPKIWIRPMHFDSYTSSDMNLLMQW